MCKESVVRAALTAAQEHCALCPRRCGAVRRETAGLCGMGAELKVARAALHYWEEPCISGRDGSGTVFFSGCTLRCVFCQNREISAGGFGQAISVERLREVFRELEAAGASNINLVSPTQFAPWIALALEEVPGIPVVWNTGGYERVETLRLLEGKSADLFARSQIRIREVEPSLLRRSGLFHLGGAGDFGNVPPERSVCGG